MNYYPRKRFGQHFLSDADVIFRIINAIAPQRQDIIVEIGCGEGALTYPLLERVAYIHGIEIDRNLAESLERETRQSDKLQIHCADALKIDFAKLLGKCSVRIVGNIPYNISTPLIFRLASFHDNIIDIHLMLQREVVERLIASPPSKQYGRLSVVAGCCFEIKALFDVPPQAFTPPPKVVSSVAYFKPQPVISAQALIEIDKIVRLAFAARRKTAANALASLFDEETLEYIGVNPRQRADSIEISQFLCMLKYLDEKRRNNVTE